MLVCLITIIKVATKLRFDFINHLKQTVTVV